MKLWWSRDRNNLTPGFCIIVRNLNISELVRYSNSHYPLFSRLSETPNETLKLSLLPILHLFEVNISQLVRHSSSHHFLFSLP